MMQLRRDGITDTRVLAAIESTPRELFVAPNQHANAYANHALPIACNQTISQPTIVAMMTQALQVNDRHLVLEIGTGSGYQAAVLSRLARRGHTIERHKTLHETACHRFEQLMLRNITAHLGDGSEGWAHAAPYDRIMVTAATEEIPAALLTQLRPEGRLVLPLGRDGEVQQLTVVHREGETFVRTPMARVQFVPLIAGA